MYCFTEVTSLLLLQQCIIFVPVIYLFVLQQSNIPLWASLQFHQILFLPHIGFAAIALPIYDFRAHPVGGASDRLDSCTRHADGLDTFAGSKVSQLYVPWWVSQDVRTWWNEKTKRARSYPRASRGLPISLVGSGCRLLQRGYKEPVPELRLTEQLKGKGKLFLWLWWWNTGRLISKMSKYCIPFSSVYIYIYHTGSTLH